MSKNVFQRTEVEETPPRARKATPLMPLWVKVSLVIILILVLLFVILHLTGNGMGHMHMSFTEAGGRAL